MENKLTPLAEILSKHRDDEEDVELKVGEKPADLLRRLGLKNAHDLPAFQASNPPPANPQDNNAMARWFVKFVRQNFLPSFLGGGFTQLEYDAMLGDGNTTVDMSRADTRREMSRLRDRMTRLANRLDPSVYEASVTEADAYEERLKQFRARIAETGPRRGMKP